MSDAAVSHRIRDTVVREMFDRTIYIDQFYVALDSELTQNLYKPALNSVPFWVADLPSWKRGLSRFIQPRVCEVDVTSLTPRNEPPYIVTVKTQITNFNYRVGFAGALDNLKEVRYDNTNYKMLIEYFGIKLATPKDVTDLILKLDRETMAVTALPCRVNDFVYANATAAAPTGTPDYGRSVFDKAAHPPVRFAGKNVVLSTAEITFYTEKAAHNYTPFNGISGTIPQTFNISPNSAGQWIVRSNKVIPVTVNLEDRGKVNCHKVMRSIIQAPTSYKWNSNTYPAWDWGG